MLKYRVTEPCHFICIRIRHFIYCTGSDISYTVLDPGSGSDISFSVLDPGSGSDISFTAQYWILNFSNEQHQKSQFFWLIFTVIVLRSRIMSTNQLRLNCYYLNCPRLKTRLDPGSRSMIFPTVLLPVSSESERSESSSQMSSTLKVVII